MVELDDKMSKENLSEDNELAQKCWREFTLSFFTNYGNLFLVAGPPLRQFAFNFLPGGIITFIVIFYAFHYVSRVFVVCPNSMES